VGIFNGCSSQWNSPTDGWGQRYGGVTAKAQCANLPDDLKPGCLFRYGFFNDADNPAVSFQRVKCPAELTARTGCARKDEL
jgi:hypothetical protein